MGPVSGAPGSPLMNSFATGVGAVHAALAATTAATSAGRPSIGISRGQVSVGTPRLAGLQVGGPIGGPLVVGEGASGARR